MALTACLESNKHSCRCREQHAVKNRRTTAENEEDPNICLFDLLLDQTLTSSVTSPLPTIRSSDSRQRSVLK